LEGIIDTKVLYMMFWMLAQMYLIHEQNDYKLMQVTAQ